MYCSEEGASIANYPVFESFTYCLRPTWQYRTRESNKIIYGKRGTRQGFNPKTRKSKKNRVLGHNYILSPQSHHQLAFLDD